MIAFAYVKIVQSAQVSMVGPGQQNIVRDAANEPSIALNPENIVIGWRQSDNVASNFRQAGWADSTATPAWFS